MGLFTTAKPKITKQEYTYKVRNELAGEGFNSKELAYVDQLVQPHLSDASPYDPIPGVDAQELAEIKEEVEKPDPHHVYNVKLPQHKIEILERILDKYEKK